RGRGGEGEARQVPLPGQRQVEQKRVGDLGDLCRGALVGGGDDEHHADLAGDGRRRLQVPEDRVVTVYPQVKVPRSGGQVEHALDPLGQYLVHELNPDGEGAQDAGVADADEGHRLVAGHRGALKLVRVLRSGLEARSLDPDDALAQRRVAGVGYLDGAAWLAHGERVGGLVEHVGRDGRGRAGGAGIQWLDGEPVVVDPGEHAACPGAGRALPAALDDL